MLHTYLHGLEESYRIATARWARAAPLTDAGGQTEVLVFDLASFVRHDGPFTGVDLNGLPYIVLPSRNGEPTVAGEHARARAEAAHEAMHVFNYRERPFEDFAEWEWFDDALAVYAEMLLLPDNRDHFRYIGDWLDCPEIPLDAWPARYQAALFLRYLDRRCDAPFANRVWLTAAKTDLPVDALAKLMPPGLKFLSADPADLDLFASGYCLDSYFLRDPQSPALA